MVGWGSAPYEKTAITQTADDDAETPFLRVFISRGIVISPDGVKVPLVPEFNEYGGTSIATDIVQTSDGYVVVGSVSTGIPVDRQEDIDDHCDGEDEPVSDCIYSLDRHISTGLFYNRAVKWTLSNSLTLPNP